MIDNGIERINKVLISDKYVNPENVIALIRSDLLLVASNYLEFENDHAMVALEVNADGDYDFMFRINAKRLKGVGILPQKF